MKRTRKHTHTVGCTADSNKKRLPEGGVFISSKVPAFLQMTRY